MNIKASQFQRDLLKWFDENRRELPWRQDKDPYKIWLSEIMLQQTTVQTVTPRWKKFLKRWPTLQDLANAELDDVLHEWTGLGYYARARNLHKAARTLVHEFEGEFPRSYELLLSLPGMGPYTAAAVSSIAFGEAVPVVDANVERVIARISQLKHDIKSTKGRKLLKEAASLVMSEKRSGDFNEAMMELGALVCLSKAPQCAQCPVRKYCKARQSGDPTGYPLKAKKAPLKESREVALLISAQKHFFLVRRPEELSFGGMWETPRTTVPEDKESEEAVKTLAQGLSLAHQRFRSLLKLKHVVMRKKITLRVYGCEKPTRKGIEHPERWQGDWFTLEEWKDLPKSATQKRVVEYLAGERVEKGAPAGEQWEEGSGQEDLFGSK